MLILIILIVFFGTAVISGIVQYFRAPKPPNGLTWREYNQYYTNKEWLYNDIDNDDMEDEEDNELHEIQKNERIMLLDETLVKYNKLLENLDEQLQYTTDSRKRSAILSKQIITLEKLNKALEKREKLE